MEMEAEAYYYGRDAGWNPVVTICLLKNEAGQGVGQNEPKKGEWKWRLSLH